MGVYIKGMEMPQCCGDCHVGFCKQIGCDKYIGFDNYASSRHPDCTLDDVLTPHGRMIDADKLHEATYHRAFGTDGDTMWQSGCWVRYRAIEQVQDSQPTIIEAEEGD